MLSWYFDRDFYLATNPDIAETGLDPLLHFIERGCARLRSPHPLVDLPYMAAGNAAALGAVPRPDALADMLEHNLARPSPYFDPDHYLATDGAAAAGSGLLRRFLQHGLQAGRRPNPHLDPAWYAQRYDDVPNDPYLAMCHFLLQGDAEGRAAGPAFDGALYRARYPDVAEAGVPPLRHYLEYGEREGRQAPTERRAALAVPAGAGRVVTIDPDTVLAIDRDLRTRIDAAREQRRQAVRVSLHPAASPNGDSARLTFPRTASPRLSILISARHAPDAAIACLRSLQTVQPQLAFEVVLVDDGMPASASAWLQAVPNLVWLRRATKTTFPAACNQAFARCRGEYVLLLADDTQVMPGAIEALVAALDADPAVAAVGPRLLASDGRLQEAGRFLRANGEIGMVGSHADPSEAGFCQDRDVTCCSGAALMFRRALAGATLFDDAYDPESGEDADLCLRFVSAGHRVRHVGGAMMLHHSRDPDVHAFRAMIRGRQRLVARWGDLIRRLDAVRVLAFYLPQFHPTPENDLWWGTGFTEWTNVTKAQPSYVGHYQPHLPADLGFYDLRTPEALTAQALLARRYGIEGFCVYYYNFGKRRVLDRPLATVRAHPGIPFRWCLCWANENWTRQWDGGEREILMAQNYDPDTLDAVIADAVSHAADPRYIRVDGLPLFLVYRPLLLPDAPAFARACRAGFAAAGFPGVHLAYVESVEAAARNLHPADLGFDASVEFPPHGHAVPATSPAEIVKEDWSGYRYDYPATVLAFLQRDAVPCRRYPAVFPGWDNTPRQSLRGTSFDGASPEAFRVYVEEKIEHIRRSLTGEQRLLFVNAWNEWSEGAHLEPDSFYGHRWLEALRDAVEAKARP
ncbi:glycoside hydrolase family 99-like domain-containing protein [Rhodovastum atsumiense]|uniref:glycoside hydrolase family 99-like domain-containing protein n=1 Tax=Rhodovastum atsumiense TaxID=504468 RepID=UPI00139F2959|nr:glycoside hydrolase family 99-like domain-containing protein [Rhodovastum atsumiense]